MSRSIALAALLLVVGVMKNNAHKWVDDDLKPWVWNASGGAYEILLLIVVAIVVGSLLVTIVALLLASFSLQVAGCSIWYMLDPWPLNGDELCSSKLHAPLGLLGLALVMLLAGVLYERNRSQPMETKT